MGTSVNLTGTYGLTGQDGTTDNFTQVIRFNSYCAGTRDDSITIQVVSDYNNGTYDVVYAGTNFIYTFISYSQTIIDGIIKIPGRQPSRFTTIIDKIFDPSATTPIYLGYLTASAGYVDGFIEIEILSYKNYPNKKTGPNILVDVSNNAPYSSLLPSIFVYLDLYEFESGSTVTGNIKLDGLYVGQTYTVSFFDENYNFYTLTDVFGTSQTGFVATTESMNVAFEVPSSIFNSTNMVLTAQINILSVPLPSEA